MEARERELRIFRTFDGRIPYLEWFNGLRDRRAKQRIEARLARLRLGNPGHVRSLKDGVWELKIDHGPGYRVYYAEHDLVVVVLLCGGDKRTQREDIAAAKAYWRAYMKEQEDADR
jgi:putative addiction module killer protein